MDLWEVQGSVCESCDPVVVSTVAAHPDCKLLTARGVDDLYLSTQVSLPLCSLRLR